LACFGRGLIFSVTVIHERDKETRQETRQKVRQEVRQEVRRRYTVTALQRDNVTARQRDNATPRPYNATPRLRDRLFF
jgi:hypothetical protein